MGREENKTQKFILSAEAVDEISALTMQALEKGGSEPRMRTRLRLAVEDALLRWMRVLGEGAPCRFQTGKRIGRWHIRIFVEGARVDPFETADEMDLAFSAGQDYLSYLGIVPSYDYRNGENVLLLQFKKVKKRPLQILGITLLAALAVGFLCSLLPQETQAALTETVITPVFDKFMGFLSALAGPMMFLTVIWGIYGIGDVNSLGAVGKRLFPQLIIMMLLGLLLAACVAIPIFFVSMSGASLSGGGLTTIFQMILDIIPENIITPFTEMNTLQLIFLAVTVGLAALLLNQKVPVFTQLIQQSNSIVQLLMEAVAALVPLAIFLSVVRIIISGSFSELSGIAKLVAVVLPVVLLMVVSQLGAVCIKYKLPPGRLIKKIAPVFLIALSTASSAAAYSENVITCEDRLGIDKRLVNFGLPIGTVLYGPAYAIQLFIAAVCMAERYQVAMSAPWLVMALFMALMLSIASPPVPGGGLACYAILFLQLGIPASSLALVLALESFTDYLFTAFDAIALEMQLVLAADKLDMLDKEKLLA